jgi:hypothetical protein
MNCCRLLLSAAAAAVVAAVGGMSTSSLRAGSGSMLFNDGPAPTAAGGSPAYIPAEGAAAAPEFIPAAAAAAAGGLHASLLYWLPYIARSIFSFSPKIS